MPNLRMRALVSVSSCNAHGYDVRFDSTDPHVLADGRKLRLTPQGGLFVTTTSQFRDLHAGNEDKLRSTISANCGTVAASAVKFSSTTPVTGKQLHLRADHVHTARLRYIQRHKLAKGIENVSLRTEHCGPCGLAKNFRKHVPHTSDRPPSARPLELVHMDTFSCERSFRGIALPRARASAADSGRSTTSIGLAPSSY